MINEVNEQIALRNLLRNHKQFTDFYNSERHKIISPVIWIRDESLNSEMAYAKLQGTNMFGIGIKKMSNSIISSFQRST